MAPVIAEIIKELTRPSTVREATKLAVTSAAWVGGMVAPFVVMKAIPAAGNAIKSTCSATVAVASWVKAKAAKKAQAEA